MLLNLSLVPDDIKFTQELKEEATEIPAGYEFDFDQQKKVNRALGHSKVKLTWDQTDAKRENKLRNGFTRDLDDEDAEKEYYKGLIASSSDEEGDAKNER